MQRRNLTLFLGLAAVLSGIARASIETTVPAPVGARLVGLDLPGRIAGSFFVILKSDADLSAFDTASPTTSTSAKAAALPGQNDVEPVEAPTPPTSVPDLVQRFGTDLANRMPGATLFSAYAVGDYKAVVIHGASDNLIKSIAANDPRGICAEPSEPRQMVPESAQ